MGSPSYWVMEGLEGIGVWGVTFSQPDPPSCPVLTTGEDGEAPHPAHGVLRATVGRDTQVCKSGGHRRCCDAACVFHVPWGI